MLDQQVDELFLPVQVYGILLSERGLNPLQKRWAWQMSLNMVRDVLRSKISLLDYPIVPVLEETEDGHVGTKKIATDVVPMVLPPLLFPLLDLSEVKHLSFRLPRWTILHFDWKTSFLANLAEF